MTVAFVDVEVARNNIRDFHARADKAGVAVRAHVKGHRTVELAAEQMAAGARGIAVTRVSGLSAYLRAGIRDVVVAWPWRDTARLERFVALAGVCRLSFHVDAPETVSILAKAAEQRGVTVGVRLQVGDGRQDVAEVPWEPIAAMAAEVAGAEGVFLDGVTHYRAILTADEARTHPARTRDAVRRLVSLADRLRADGHPVATVALGGTPAAAADLADLTGITELGAGAYVLGDAGLARLGLGGLDDIAVSLPLTAAPFMEACGCGQPWGVDAAVRRQGRLVPGHVCPLMLAVKALETSHGDRWEVLNGEDAT